MENPLHRLPMLNPLVPPGTFMRGFIGGAGSGALMMGIFYTGLIAFTTATFSLPLLGLYALGVGTTGLFSGIMASKRASDAARSARHASREVTLSRAPARAPQHNLVPAIAADAVDGRPIVQHQNEPATGRWQSQVERRGSGSVAQILANGTLSDKERAAAILSACESAVPSERAH